MKIWIVILGLQFLHYAACDEDHKVTTVATDSVGTTVATDSVGTTVATDSVGTTVAVDDSATIAARVTTKASDVLSQATCCSLRHCPTETTICLENTDHWGCECELTEEQKKLREEKAKAVREKYGIKEKDDHDHNHDHHHHH